MNLNLTSTPIEKYKVGNKEVFVKREDLCGAFPLPPLGKLRGLAILLEKLYKDGTRFVGCWDTRVSKLGQGVAVMSSTYPEMNSIISYPLRKGEPEPASIQIARQYNAEIFPLRGNHPSICLAQVDRYIKKSNGVLLPFGLECKESVDAISIEANQIPRSVIANGTLVLSCGSGVTLSGILRGLKHKPNKVIGISSGRSINKIKSCIVKYVRNLPNFLEIYEPLMPYNQPVGQECPFPSHPNYDRKAWKFLIENITHLHKPILFWNIGS